MPRAATISREGAIRMIERRRFLTTGAAFTALSGGRISGANDRVRLAGIGTGGRGTYLLTLAVKAEKTELVAVCDAYEPRRLAARQKLAPDARDYVDYRE